MKELVNVDDFERFYGHNSPEEKQQLDDIIEQYNLQAGLAACEAEKAPVRFPSRTEEVP